METEELEYGAAKTHLAGVHLVTAGHPGLTCPSTSLEVLNECISHDPFQTVIGDSRCQGCAVSRSLGAAWAGRAPELGVCLRPHTKQVQEETWMDLFGQNTRLRSQRTSFGYESAATQGIRSINVASITKSINQPVNQSINQSPFPSV